MQVASSWNPKKHTDTFALSSTVKAQAKTRSKQEKSDNYKRFVQNNAKIPVDNFYNSYKSIKWSQEMLTWS